MYEHRAGEKISDSVKCATVMSMCTGPLLEHMQLNSGRLREYPALRDEIIRYIEGRYVSSGASFRGPAPMDVGLVSGVGRVRPEAGEPWKPRAGAGAGKGGPKGGCFECGAHNYPRDCARGAPCR